MSREEDSSDIFLSLLFFYKEQFRVLLYFFMHERPTAELFTSSKLRIACFAEDSFVYKTAKQQNMLPNYVAGLDRACISVVLLNYVSYIRFLFIISFFSRKSGCWFSCLYFVTP